MKLDYLAASIFAIVLLVGVYFVIPVQNLNKNKNMTEQNNSGLVIVDEIVGNGDEAIPGTTVTVHYLGTLVDGTMFDASRNRGSNGFTFSLGRGEVIKGWDLGVAGMKVGGKRKLTIPPELAYGNRAVGSIIPANATLVFDVELLKVVQ